MREYERIGNRILAKNGANLSAVLYGLSIDTDEEKQSLQRLLNWIQQLPDEPYRNFEFVVVQQLNDVIFGFKPSSRVGWAKRRSDIQIQHDIFRRFAHHWCTVPRLWWAKCRV